MSADHRVTAAGRRLIVVANDRESENRTPERPLIVLPAAARDSFAAIPPVPAMRPGEDDLTRIGPGRNRAAGMAITISGRVLDSDLRPVRRTLIEVWNANTHGRYAHADDEGRSPSPLDPYFHGFGRLVTDNDGRFRVRTIKPGGYVARADIDWKRPPHVHFSVVGGGTRLVTQMYFPEEPLNLKDHIYLAIPESLRSRAVGKTIATANDAEPAFSFDMVVRGRYQTPLDDDD